MYDFDDAVTAPLHGFTGTDDYWTRARQQAVARGESRCPRWCSTRATIRSCPPPRCRARRGERGGHAGAARRTAATPASCRGPFPGRLDWLPQRTDSTIPSQRVSIAHAFLAPEIFKAYDIRGIVGKTLTPEVVRAVGQALGTLAQERGRDTLVIGRDGRLSGPELARALGRRHPRRAART